ncbi:MAG: acyl-CoA synthetase, partial [Burkholderiaceae bacterium]
MPSHPDSRDQYAAMQARFGWQVPAHLNMAHACCVRWATHAEHGKNIAVIADGTSAEATFHSYSDLWHDACRLSNVLTGMGVARGDRVAIVLPQRYETAVAYMGVMQAGAVGMPLSMLFGPEALAYRLQDSAAQVAICDEAGLAPLLQVRSECPTLRHILVVGQAAADDPMLSPWHQALGRASSTFTCVDTLADDPAVLIYTSGTTGNPKGGLIPHRALVGNLSGFVCSQNLFGFAPGPGGELPFPSALVSAGTASAETGPADVAHALPTGSQAVFWSPADWAWTGGLMDALLPTLYFGRPIVAYNGRFSPEVAFTLMQRHGVTHSFLFPTALKAMMKAYPEPRKHFSFQLHGLMSAGEAVGDAVFAWCRDQMGVVVNEMFGQTEVNYIVGNFCLGQVWGEAGDASAAGLANLGWPAKPGSMGKGYPGHRVSVIDDDGNECPNGVPGEVAVHALSPNGQPDPIFMLGYWNKPEATLAKFTGPREASWFRTGDMAVRDEDGYLWHHGRADDVFKSAGYRIGPSEIENCLVKHPAVLNAAVVPKPDAERGALVKAYVVLAPDYIAANPCQISAEGIFDAETMAPLVAQLQAHVKTLLAPYEYPKEIEFVEQLPMTTTGKVQRRILRLQEDARARSGLRG